MMSQNVQYMYFKSTTSCKLRKCSLLLTNRKLYPGYQCYRQWWAETASKVISSSFRWCHTMPLAYSHIRFLKSRAHSWQKWQKVAYL